MILGATRATPRIPTPRPILNAIASHAEALVIFTADETVVEVVEVAFVGERAGMGAAE